MAAEDRSFIAWECTFAAQNEDARIAPTRSWTKGRDGGWGYKRQGQQQGAAKHEHTLMARFLKGPFFR
eukprot:1193868-Prorocentrum_minimum.AAC.1